MAARENQGLQIALIIFVMLTLVLIVTTFLFFQSNQEAKETIKGLNNDIRTAQDGARQASEDIGKLLDLVDVKLDKLEAVEAEAKKDFEAHGKGLAELSYRNLVAQMAKERDDLNKRVADLTAETEALGAKIAADEKAKQEEFAKYAETVQKTSQDLEGVRTEFTSFREKMAADNAELNKKFEDKASEYDKLTQTSSKEITDLKDARAKQDRLLDIINEEKTRSATANEVPDGKVTWVNQRSRTVWIDRGPEDGLRLQTSFSVFDSTVSNPAEGERTAKGKIEVIRHAGPHLAEARIVEDDLSDPMMPGDKIFSLVWEPGRAEHFALAGFMDIDGDGASDRKRIHDLISLNGGVIDEEIADDGTKTGEMTINTKYLILGDEPTNVGRQGSLAGYSEIMGEARGLGVKTINVMDFMNYLGYKPEDRTVPLGASGRSSDFRARLPDDVQRVVPGSEPPRDLRRPVPGINKDNER